MTRLRSNTRQGKVTLQQAVSGRDLARASIRAATDAHYTTIFLTVLLSRAGLMRCKRHPEHEAGLLRRGGHAERTMVRPRDLGCDVEAQAQTLLCGPRASCKGFEQSCLQVWRDRLAAVGGPQGELAIEGSCPYPGRLGLGAMRRRIAEQVRAYLAGADGV